MSFVESDNGSLTIDLERLTPKHTVEAKYGSPTRQKKKYENERIKIENEQLKNEWEFCCSRSSRDAVKYMTQIGIASSILIFSFIRLSVTDDDKEIYYSLISFVLGVIFPSPSFAKKKN